MIASSSVSPERMYQFFVAFSVDCPYGPAQIVIAMRVKSMASLEFVSNVKIDL